MYDEVTAAHYSAYRPPLHSAILTRALHQSRARETGLDIGCGTGYSARELANFCNFVVGLEPSEAMLGQAGKHAKVKFVNAPGEKIPLVPCSVDVVTLAGSLNYIERNSLVNELARICRADAEIIVYDFEVNLNKFEQYFGVKRINCSPEYDHAANFRGYTSLLEIACEEDELSVIASPREIAHLLLSNRVCHDALSEKFNTSNPVKRVEIELSSMSNLIPVNSSTFYSVYTLS